MEVAHQWIRRKLLCTEHIKDNEDKTAMEG
jgi:hypothetical protein